MQKQRKCILQANQSLIHWASTELQHTDGNLKYTRISRNLIYLSDLQIDISLHNNSRAYYYPPGVTCNPISINKHLLGAFFQQQI
jgi:hypothetical protein